MRLFVFEWLIGGGLLIDCHSFPASAALLAQARAMVGAVVADLRIAGHQVTTMIDGRWGSVSSGLDVEGRVIDSLTMSELVEQALQADAVWVIAPEMGGRLLNLVLSLESAGCRLLTPGSRFVALAASKQASAEFLHRHAVQSEWGRLVDLSREAWPTDWQPPYVIKPDDGVGSEGLHWVSCETQLPEAGVWRLESLLTGRAISLSALLGPCGQRLILEPSYQRFDGHPFGHYIGGTWPIDEALRRRAVALAERALHVLPSAVGIVGFDMVIDPDLPEENDRIVDINPRLTSSYVGLRRMYATNLADLAVRIAGGDNPPDSLAYATRAWEFEVT